MSTGSVTGRPGGEPRWRIRSLICMSTPSIRCSTARPALDEAIAAAVADGQPAMAITDHGNMYGVLDFYRGCKDQGIKPIIGTEIYLAHESRHERPSRRGRADDSGGDTGGGKKSTTTPSSWRRTTSATRT